MAKLEVEVKVFIEAPALVAVLERFVSILGKGGAVSAMPAVEKAEASVVSVQQVATQQPVQSIPAQQVPVQPPVQSVPVQQPTQPSVQSVPVQQTTQPSVQSVPTQAPTYTFDQLALAGSQLVSMGDAKRAELIGLLASFGVQALTELSYEQYGAFATKLRELGAQI